MIKNSILLIVTVLVLGGCFTEKGPESWTAWIYPDKTNIKRSMELGNFESLEMCRKASIDKLTALDLITRGDYKCGLRCEYNKSVKSLVCEKTSK